MDDVDEIDDSHPESTDAFAAYIADGGMEDRDRAPVYCPGNFFGFNPVICKKSLDKLIPSETFVSNSFKHIVSYQYWKQK